MKIDIQKQGQNNTIRRMESRRNDNEYNMLITRSLSDCENDGKNLTVNKIIFVLIFLMVK
jgi:hypothetical protein